MKVAALTNTGLIRQQNEDRYLVDSDQGLFVVCDGMGGHNAGEVAAQIAIDTMVERFSFQAGESPHAGLIRSIMEANHDILAKGQETEEFSNMGTTITAAYIKDMTLYVASIGDSSLFVINHNEIEKITRDHTLAEQLFEEGLVGENERAKHVYRHILTRALGIEENVEVDCHTRNLNPGEYVFITSDGLTDLVGHEEIKNTVLSDEDMAKALEKLLGLALERGGHDNMTMILIQLP